MFIATLNAHAEKAGYKPFKIVENVPVEDAYAYCADLDASTAEKISAWLWEKGVFNAVVSKTCVTIPFCNSTPRHARIKQILDATAEKVDPQFTSALTKVEKCVEEINGLCEAFQDWDRIVPEVKGWAKNIKMVQATYNYLYSEAEKLCISRKYTDERKIKLLNGYKAKGKERFDEYCKLTTSDASTIAQIFQLYKPIQEKLILLKTKQQQMKSDSPRVKTCCDLIKRTEALAETCAAILRQTKFTFGRETTSDYLQFKNFLLYDEKQEYLKPQKDLAEKVVADNETKVLQLHHSFKALDTDILAFCLQERALEKSPLNNRRKRV